MIARLPRTFKQLTLPPVSPMSLPPPLRLWRETEPGQALPLHRCSGAEGHPRLAGAHASRPTSVVRLAAVRDWRVTASGDGGDGPHRPVVGAVDLRLSDAPGRGRERAV